MSRGFWNRRRMPHATFKAVQADTLLLYRCVSGRCFLS